jgi:hypothetical protein
VRENEALNTEVVQLRSLVNINGSPTWFNSSQFVGGDAWVDDVIDLSAMDLCLIQTECAVSNTSLQAVPYDTSDCSRSIAGSDLSNAYTREDNYRLYSNTELTVNSISKPFRHRPHNHLKTYILSEYKRNRPKQSRRRIRHDVSLPNPLHYNI